MATATAERPAAGQEAWPDLCGTDGGGPYLVGGRCRQCGGLALGRREICPHCLAATGLQEERIGRRGVLYTATVVHQAPRGFSAPYRVGYVDVEEGVRVFAHVDAGAAAPEIGEAVALTIGPVKSAEDGAPLLGPVYVRAGGSPR